MNQKPNNKSLNLPFDNNSLSYKDALTYLYSLQKYGIKFGLKNISELLNSLDNPQRNFPSVHIGGTNGKGSTAAFISSVLMKSGYRVGLYTSPHLIRFTERIKINQKEISPLEVTELIKRIRKKSAKLRSITFFEFVTAMAFLYFAEKKVDIAIIEVGMGGRLDATNIITPLLSIITNISLDHQQYLGKTISKIAFEKAGIIKSFNTLITAATQPSVRSLFKKRCNELQTNFYLVGKDFIGHEKTSSLLDYQGLSWNLSNLKIALAGSHQILNATTALGALELLEKKGYCIPKSAIRNGLEKTYWPGRLELMRKKPLLLLDGAHNPAAMKILRETIERYFKYERLILILGIMVDKDIKKIIKEIVPLAYKVIITQPQIERSAPIGLLKKYVRKWCKNIESIARVKEAVSSALLQAKKEDLILITGSLFTVGEARDFLENNQTNT